MAIFYSSFAAPLQAAPLGLDPSSLQVAEGDFNGQAFAECLGTSLQVTVTSAG